MKVYKYKNYDHYVQCQKAANKKKSSNVWAVEENIKYIANFLMLYNPKRGMCHGVRQGHEVRWFQKYLDCKVIGTEIGDASAKDVVKWDFNKFKREWVKKFDFIYSNSFDHSFDPKATLKTWYSQLKIGGLIILEYDKRQEHTGEISMPVNKTDPVSVEVDELVDIVPKWIDGAKVHVLDLPHVKIEWQKAVIIEKH